MDITAYKGKLEEEKTLLEKELGTLGRRNPSNPNDWEAVPQETGPEPDPNDRADQMEEYSENNAILTDLEVRYNEVTGALARIAGGSYGTCKVCGKEIETERLDVDPSADTCKEHLDQ
jgi:RNA polymerase-binding transcription factor DksA